MVVNDSPLSRRHVLAGGTTAAFGSLPVAAAAGRRPPAERMLSAAAFGAVGNGSTDDTQALQTAFDETFRSGGGFLLIPPGTYRVTRSLRLLPPNSGDIRQQSGIIAHGVRILSDISDGRNVIEIVSHTTIQFLLVEGLEILGMGKEGHGLYVECDSGSEYLYNFCLRDIVVRACGGDGCRIVGNVFEGQIINSYFRKNGGNGLTFSHSEHGGILSAIHVFGCVCGNNAVHGAALLHNCYDVGFHGCYFLLNGAFGLAAGNGCTLLSNCGFENNHARAPDFAHGDAGIYLASFGTLVGCTGYSVFNQTRLLRAHITDHLTMIGCAGSGGGRAAAAGLALLSGTKAAVAIMMGCKGAIETAKDFEAIEIGAAGGVRFGSNWDSNILPQLGEYRLWVDKKGRLRLKDGVPTSDEDGAPVGA